jgi:hypothetical protein
MARLVVKGPMADSQVIELHLGPNRLGRSSKNHFQVEHPTVSSTHCEIVLAEGGLLVRDCDSTNGTFVDGRRIEESGLSVGQVLRLGDLEILVETTDVAIAIPHIEVSLPAPPVVRSDGSLDCPRHPGATVTHRCTHCRAVMCDACVHRLRRHGGKLHKFCPLCSRVVVLIGPEKKQKRSLFGLWRKTIKLPFLHGSKSKQSE